MCVCVCVRVCACVMRRNKTTLLEKKYFVKLTKFTNKTLA
ncbi:hypothetical protein GBAR_LOCUS22824 [Geodia barretti]|uniref:Uncharacterized protein n=1 Tax=Geodia barretti TaxID=519541 RepID=A0AA35T4X8_GEOBA|nr:hypothetical protein GBAR_LOCUS22824 [Geodia barretti]